MLNFLRSIDSKIGIRFICFIATANYYFLILSVPGIIDQSFYNEGGILILFLYGLPLSIAATALTAALMRKFKKKRKRHINGIIHTLHLTIFTLIIIFIILIAQGII
jgi:hypothetical protein